MSKVPVIEQDALANVKVTLDQLVKPAKKAKEPTKTASVGFALADIQAEHQRRATYISHIQQYVSGRRNDSPVRIEPNVPV